MKQIILVLSVVFSQMASTNQLAMIKLNPLQVELSREAQDNIAEFDKNFVMHTFASYSEKVQKIFLEDPDTLNRETPMAVLGYFDCDNTLDLAVMGTSRGKDVVVTLLSSRGFKASLLPQAPIVKPMKTALKSARYLSINQNIPLKASTCRGARKTIDLIQSEEEYSGDTHAFYYKKGKWVLYTGQDL